MWVRAPLPAPMDKEELKQYLKDNLQISVDWNVDIEDYGDYSYQSDTYLNINISLENEIIAEVKA